MFCAASSPKGRILLYLCGCVVLLGVSAIWAQEVKTPGIPPQQLVRETVANEVAAANGDSVKHVFCSRKKTPKGSQTRLYAETDDAMAGMLIAINDQPLNAQQVQAERDHLDWLTRNPDQLKKKRAREKEDADRTLRIVKALPDAFLYQCAGTENSGPDLGKSGDRLVRLDFKPNPAYSPPSRIEQVLQGMQGYLLIDPDARRLAKIDGILFRDVSFGWGIIGHLDKGGSFVVQQADIGEGDWEITRISLKMSGKILMFKSISMVSDEVFSDFRRESANLTFAQGVELLKTESEKRAHLQSTQSSELRNSAKP